MAYADAQYYLNIYKGTAIPEAEIDRRLVRASDDVDSLTYNRIQAAGFDNLTVYQQEQVKKAACAQAEFLHQYGEFTDLPLKSFSAGSISLSLGEVVNGVTASRTAIRYLGLTGLTSRRI